jgi:phytoene dehydrogenase-like protein
MNPKYDAVIIGSGIGGLVCGCYLAQTGLKVLIIEQHYKPGGYCTSFERQGYRFDVGVHYVGSIKRGVLGKILKELDLERQLRFKQFDPADKIIMPDSVTYIRANPNDTIKEFIKSFPKNKKNIEAFFSFAMQKDFIEIYSKVKKLSFKELLDSYFTNNNLKSTIGSLLRNLALSPSMTPALNAIIFLREFTLDPGYYPLGGMQQIPDALVEKFKKLGGELALKKRVIKIKTNGEEVKSVVTEDWNEITAKVIISNVDLTKTFKSLLEIKTEETIAVEKLLPTSSMFVVYLGLNVNLKNFLKESAEIWHFPDYDSEGYLPPSREELLGGRKFGLMISFPYLHDPVLSNSKKSTVQIFSFAPLENEQFWETNRDFICNNILNKTEEILPFLNRNFIEVRNTATPHSFYRYTSNLNGACFGWIPSTTDKNFSGFKNKTSIKGFFLCGQWCNNGNDVGVSGVALSGRKCAEIVLKDLAKKWNHKIIRL